MSASYFFSLLALYLLLSLDSPHIAMGGRIIPPSAPSTVTRPLVSSQEAQTFLKPKLDQKERVFQSRQAKDCLPKGFRHNSAPSRFVNYDTLSSGACSRMHSKKP